MLSTFPVPLTRDDEDGQDDRREAAGADSSGAPRHAGHLHEHGEGAAASPHLRYPHGPPHSIQPSFIYRARFMQTVYR